MPTESGGFSAIILPKEEQEKTKPNLKPQNCARLDALGADDEAAMKFGIEYATRQCEEPLRAGAPGLHFYTLNNAPATVQVLKNLGLA